MILSQANSLHWSVKSRGIGNIFYDFDEYVIVLVYSPGVHYEPRYFFFPLLYTKKKREGKFWVDFIIQAVA